jgi:hypothetical protein
MKEEDFITKLIEETCKDEKEDEAPAKVSELSDYFEKRVNQVEFLSLEKYLAQQDLQDFSLAFISNTKCFRLQDGKTTLDFPSNWSVFENVNVKAVQLIASESDTDFLCDIFNEAFDGCESFVLLNESGKCRVVLFKDHKYLEHYEWMLNYFSKKELDIQKQAA